MCITFQTFYFKFNQKKNVLWNKFIAIIIKVESIEYHEALNFHILLPYIPVPTYLLDSIFYHT